MQSTNNSYISDRDILLVFPGKHHAPNPQVPLALLHLASPLLNEGYNVRILDMRIDDYRNFSVGNPVFAGITSMSGHQIKYGLEFAKKVKAELPNCPVVWGGVHPTLLPEQTVQHELVDIVVRGEGEATIVELANKLCNSQPLDNVKGLTYKHNGKTVSTPDREFIDPSTLPLSLPYHLLPKERYPSLQAGRVHIQTSRGCPHRCGFCYNSIVNKSVWRGKSPQRVLEEIKTMKQEFPKIKCIDIIDDNFFVDKERVAQICRGKIQNGLETPWRANCRFDYLASYEGEFVSLLEESRCKELNFGAETGSPRLLSLIRKDITPNQMAVALQNLQRWAPSIEPYVFWMSGYPTETKEDLYQTFKVMDDLKEANKKTQHIEMYVFTPFPSPMLEMLRPGFEPPQSLEEWGSLDIFHFKPPWHTKKYVKLLDDISVVTRYAFYPEERISEFGLHCKVGYWLLNRAALFRWQHKLFRFAYEMKTVGALTRRLKGY